jgi:hypothetical protein
MALNLKPDSLPANLKEQDLIPYIQKLYSQRLTGGVGVANLPEANAKENCAECGLK